MRFIPQVRLGVLAAAFVTCGCLTAATTGHLFVTDDGTSEVVKYIASGAEKTFASIPDCQGLAFDGNGVLYVASYNGSTIYKVGAHGSYTVFASGPLIENPSYLTFDKSGNLFVSHYGSKPGIAKIAPNGSIRPFVSGLINDLAFDSAGYYLYASEYTSRFTQGVYKIAPDGTTSFFSYDMSYPTGLAFDASGNLFVVDSGVIYMFNPVGYKTVAYDDLIEPHGLAFDTNGNLFVTDSTGFILKIALDGTRSAFATGLSQPFGLAFSPPR